MALSAELATGSRPSPGNPWPGNPWQRKFDYHPVFDPITVEPTTYYASEELFQVTIV